MMVRQGDVLVQSVRKIPADAIKQDHRVLAEGEVAGHLHELDLGDVYEKNGTLYFEVPDNNAATLVHPEHKAVTFAPGKYKVTRQREYKPEGWEQVAD